jgi:glycosyltransferase 2 family protein
VSGIGALSSSSDLRDDRIGGAASAKTMPHLRSSVAFAAKIVLTGGMLLFVLRQVDLAALRGTFAGMDWALLALGLLQMLVIPFLGGVRWQLVLSAMKAKGRIWPLSRLFWIGMLFGQVLPSTAGGDVVRVFMMWRAGTSLRVAFNSVALERASMLITPIAFLALLLPFLASRVVVAELAWIAPALLVASIVGLVVLMSADRFLNRLPSLRVVRAIAGLSADARRAYLSGFGWRLIVVCIVTLVNLSVAAWWIGLSLGLPLGLADYLIFMPVVTIVTLVPVSVGGWGVREGAFVALLGLVGVPSHMALAFSVLFGFAGIVASLPAFGFLWSAPNEAKPNDCPADLLKFASDGSGT